METVERRKALGVRVVSSVVDLRDGAAVRASVDEAVPQLGQLDVVVSNAGVAFFRPFMEMTTTGTP
jgi:NAD(P)-dependent dehydrogenase (short-subunit alcohol dehydrogenase family)